MLTATIKKKRERNLEISSCSRKFSLPSPQAHLCESSLGKLLAADRPGRMGRHSSSSRLRQLKLATSATTIFLQRRRQLRKSHLKSEFALLQTVSRLFQLVQFVKCWQIFLELNSKRLYQSSGKEKESCCLVFPSSTKREIRHFHVVVVQRRLRKVQKIVMHRQSCFANLNLLLFYYSRCRCHRRCLRSLIGRLRVAFK